MGIIRLMMRLASWLMLGCLMMMQVHDFVPHHHHEDAAAVQHGAYHLGYEGASDAEFGLDVPHPEVSPHGDAELGRATTLQGHCAGHVVLADRLHVVIPQWANSAETHPALAGPPRVTGPPLASSPRGPPVSPVA